MSLNVATQIFHEESFGARSQASLASLLRGGEMEPYADAALRACKHHIKPVARALLLSTFVEDGHRMATQWGDQTAYIEATWGVTSYGAAAFVGLNLVGQLAPTALILLRRSDAEVRAAVATLAGVLLLQVVSYQVLWGSQFFLRNAAVAGSLALVYAETHMVQKTRRAGLPSVGGNSHTCDVLQAAGRVMLVIMFLTMLHFSLASPLRVGMEAAELALVGCVAVGKHSKVAACLLVLMLALETTMYNAFWAADDSAAYDMKKYDFFQTLTVIGGLLLVVACGPGGLAMDRKKDY